MLTLNIPEFRAQFPEFNDTTVYPTAMIEFWGSIAEMQLRKHIWCDMWQNGVKLYVAHEITLAVQNAKTAKAGGMPGTSGGVANTKTVGSVTVGYDSTVTSEKDAGFWNLTNYGKQLYRLMMMFGNRAVQL